MTDKRRDRYERIERIKNRIKDTPSEILRKTLSLRVLRKEGAIAYREVLEEREDKESNDDGSQVESSRKSLKSHFE